MVKSRRSAPKTINMIFMAITRPFTEAARIQFRGVFQTVKARIRAMAKATGMALVADHRIPTIRMKIAAMGNAAIRASIPVDMDRGLLVSELKIFKIF
jgi:hypothetical protein